MILLNPFKSSGPACQHNEQKLERRTVPNSKLKVGLPGVGTIFAMGSKKTAYHYRCPVCQTDLPTAQNSRWESLYNSYHPPITTTKARPTAKPQPKTSPARKGAITPQREPIRAGLRYQILERDGYKCVKCGATSAEVRLHVDHKLPVSKGGTNDPSNLQTLCEKCNLGKGTKTG